MATFCAACLPPWIACLPASIRHFATGGQLRLRKAGRPRCATVPRAARCASVTQGNPPMPLSSFGYASLRSDRIDDWAEYGAKFLGLQLVERTRSALKFRMDDRKQRIVVSAGEDAENVFGWEVED